MKTICLAMIVKNENATIRRTLESIKQCIDHWVVIDMGSTDGTQQTIQECLKDIPGELQERPLVVVSQLRELAEKRADHVLWIEPHERLHFRERFTEMEVSRMKNTVEKEPHNTGAAYQLAQCYTYRDQRELALKAYERRVSQGGGDAEEIYHSLYMIGVLSEFLDSPTEKIISSYCKAHRERPTRAEPLYRLGEFYRRKKNYFLSYLVSKFALTIRLPQDKLNVEKSVYEAGVLNQFFVSCRETGRMQEMTEYGKKRLTMPNLTPCQRALIEHALAGVSEEPQSLQDAGRRSM